MNSNNIKNAQLIETKLILFGDQGVHCVPLCGTKKTLLSDLFIIYKYSSAIKLATIIRGIHFNKGFRQLIE